MHDECHHLKKRDFTNSHVLLIAYWLKNVINHEDKHGALLCYDYQAFSHCTSQKSQLAL